MMKNFIDYALYLFGFKERQYFYFLGSDAYNSISELDINELYNCGIEVSDMYTIFHKKGAYNVISRISPENMKNYVEPDFGINFTYIYFRYVNKIID